MWLRGPYSRLLVPFWVFIVVVLAVTPLAVEGTPDFYRAASSIIPTLLLTLAVAGRFFLPGGAPQDEFISDSEWLERQEEHQGSWPETLKLAEEQLSKEDFDSFRESIEASWSKSQLARERSRQRGEEFHRRATRIFGGVVLLLLGLGEASALGALASGTEDSALFAVICGSMAAGFAAVAFLAMVGPVPESDSSNTKA
jgi:hypothetical protein